MPVPKGLKAGPSSREDYVIQQYPFMKKVSNIARNLFDTIYVDIYGNELSTVERAMVPGPGYYVDPTNPEHPAQYAIMGKSNIPYLEHMMIITPYTTDKGKYEFDLSGYKGLLMSPLEFYTMTKEFHKTKLEPIVIMGEKNGHRFNQSLVLREKDTRPKDELTLNFLRLPNRKLEGEEAYRRALYNLIYKPFYQYLYQYMRQPLQFVEIPEDTIETIKEEDIAEIYTQEGDMIIMTKALLPNLRNDDQIFVCKVPCPEIPDHADGRGHYIIREDMFDKSGSPFITIYTLLAALQIDRVDDDEETES